MEERDELQATCVFAGLVRDLLKEAAIHQREFQAEMKNDETTISMSVSFGAPVSPPCA